VLAPRPTVGGDSGKGSAKDGRDGRDARVDSGKGSTDDAGDDSGKSSAKDDKDTGDDGSGRPRHRR
jgi:hypothetical protein